MSAHNQQQEVWNFFLGLKSHPQSETALMSWRQATKRMNRSYEK